MKTIKKLYQEARKAGYQAEGSGLEWRKSYTAEWERLFNKLPPLMQKAIIASPSGSMSAALAVKAIENVEKTGGQVR